MTSATYAPSLPGHLISHGRGPTWLLRDSGLSDKEELIAQVRSGDYLVTLATLLDSISDTLTEGNEAEAMILQHLIDNLMYLDHAYKLVKK